MAFLKKMGFKLTPCGSIDVLFYLKNPNNITTSMFVDGIFYASARDKPCTSYALITILAKQPKNHQAEVLTTRKDGRTILGNIDSYEGKKWLLGIIVGVIAELDEDKQANILLDSGSYYYYKDLFAIARYHHPNLITPSLLEEIRNKKLIENKIASFRQRGFILTHDGNIDLVDPNNISTSMLADGLFYALFIRDDNICKKLIEILAKQPKNQQAEVLATLKNGETILMASYSYEQYKVLLGMIVGLEKDKQIDILGKGKERLKGNYYNGVFTGGYYYYITLIAIAKKHYPTLISPLLTAVAKLQIYGCFGDVYSDPQVEILNSLVEHKIMLNKDDLTPITQCSKNLKIHGYLLVALVIISLLISIAICIFLATLDPSSMFHRIEFLLIFALVAMLLNIGNIYGSIFSREFLDSSTRIKNAVDKVIQAKPYAEPANVHQGKAEQVDDEHQGSANRLLPVM